MTTQEILDLIGVQQGIILDRESKLQSNDYKNTKNGEAERANLPLPYDPIALHNINQAWRDDINAAEDEIKRLRALEPDDETVN